MQPLTGLEIEVVDRSGDSGRGGRAQSLLEGPQSLSLVRCLDQNHPGRIETETVEAMTVRTAVAGEIRCRHDKQQRSSPRHAAKKRRDETESGRPIAISLGYELVQGPDAFGGGVTLLGGLDLLDASEILGN